MGPLLLWGLFGFEVFVLWGLLAGAVQDGSGRLLPASERWATCAAFSGVIGYLSKVVVWNAIASGHIEVTRTCLRRDLHIGCVTLRRVLPLAQVSSYELRAVRYRGQAPLGGQHRLVAHLRGGSELVLLPNVEGQGRAHVVEKMAELNARLSAATAER